MNELLTQIILAARNRDTKGWGNIVFIVVLAVFWVIGGILKARANKKQEGEEQLTRKSGLKPSEGAGVREPRVVKKTPYEQVQRPTARTPYIKELQSQIQPPRRKIARLQAAVQQFAIKIKEAQAIPPETIELLEEPELPPPTPQVQPDLEELPQFTSKAVKELGDMRAAIPAETPRAKYLAEILLDYSDLEDLKRAILHYEILGRPLSLRDPSQHIIGL